MTSQTQLNSLEHWFQTDNSYYLFISTPQLIIFDMHSAL
jgi:hypothetical protein